jgi:hypothetical protein
MLLDDDGRLKSVCFSAACGHYNCFLLVTSLRREGTGKELSGAPSGVAQAPPRTTSDSDDDLQVGSRPVHTNEGQARMGQNVTEMGCYCEQGRHQLLEQP